MAQTSLKSYHYILAVLFLVLAFSYNYFPEQADFQIIAPIHTALFAIYGWVIWKVKEPNQVLFWISVAVAARAVLLFNLPNLSDDLYRFVWDGLLINNGQNPFTQLPSYYLEAGHSIDGLHQALYDQLNSQEYYTIYPPVAQLTFVVSTFLCPNSVWGAAVLMKGMLLALECGSIYLTYRILNRLELPKSNTLIYALNPLMINEICGNLHFEGGMVFFLLLAIWLLLEQKNGWSAVAFAMSIAAKLLPVLFLPLLLRRLQFKKASIYYVITGALTLLLFFPLLNGVFLNNFGDSLDLYFRKFEFNAFIYYIFREFGYYFHGYNVIQTLGPKLGLATFISVLILTFRERLPTLDNLPQSMLFAITIYLLFAMTVHPWYVALPLVLCSFTRFRYPVVWSFLIGFTYINYIYPTYFENLWVVAIEYSIVTGWLLWELFTSKKWAPRA